MITEDEEVAFSAKSVIGKQGLAAEEGSPAREDLLEDDGLDSIDGNRDDENGYVTDGFMGEEDGDENEQVIKELDPAQNPVNGLPFYNFMCFRLEKLWKNKREKQAHRRWKEKQRLEYILPRGMLDSMNGHSIFPFLRLLLPEQDSRRQFRVKEKKIAEAYCTAQGFGKGTKNYEMLMVRTGRMRKVNNMCFWS